MARLFIDGFESGELPGAFDSYNAQEPQNVQIVTDHPKTGTYCLRLHNLGSWIQKDLDARSSLFFKFDIYPIWDNVYDIQFTQIRLGTNVQLTFQILKTGEIRVRRGNWAGTILATSAPCIIHNTWNRLEGRIVIDNTVGVVQFKLEGGYVIDFMGDTQALASNTFDNYCLGNSDGNASYTFYADNFILEDSEWIGQGLIQGLAPTGAGNSTQWTPEPEEEDNYDCVNNIPTDDEQFIHINEADKLDLYALGDLVGPLTTIHCVQVQAITQAVNNPTPTKIRFPLRINSTNYFSSQKTPGIYEVVLYEIWEINPATSQPWQESEINAMEIGVKSET
jgi:hypothetical protein